MSTGYTIACPGRGGDSDGNSDARLLLDLNELDVDVHPSVQHAATQCLLKSTAFTRYAMPHDDVTRQLVQALAQRHGVTDRNILLTAGSDAALEYIATAFADRHVHVYWPTYQYFQHLVGRRPHTLATHDEAPRPGSLVYIVDPNNPTGARDCHPTDDATCIYIVDQAYAEFAGDDHRLTVSDTVLFTRTFSKAFGLAGLRIGYVVGPEALLGQLRRVYNEKQVTLVAKVAALQTLRCSEYYEALARGVRASRADFEAFLRRHGLPFLESHANFVAVGFGDQAERVTRQLAARGVCVRLRHDLPGYVRVTIGSPRNMERLKLELERVLSWG